MTVRRGESVPDSTPPEPDERRVPDRYAREYWEWVDSEFDRWFDEEPTHSQDVEGER